MTEPRWDDVKAHVEKRLAEERAYLENDKRPLEEVRPRQARIACLKEILALETTKSRA